MTGYERFDPVYRPAWRRIAWVATALAVMAIASAARAEIPAVVEIFAPPPRPSARRHRDVDGVNGDTWRAAARPYSHLRHGCVDGRLQPILRHRHASNSRSPGLRCSNTVMNGGCARWHTMRAVARQLVGEAEDAGLDRPEMIAELDEMAQAMRECEAE